MGRIKQTAQRSQFALVEEGQDAHVPEHGVKAEGEDVEITISDQVDGHSEQHDMSFDNSFYTESYAAELEPVSEAESFEYNDDAVDGDFKEDSGDSEYEESPRKRRGNAKPPTQKKAAKPSTPAKSHKQPVRTHGRKSITAPVSVAASSTSRSRRSRAKSDQRPRALQKALRDVESRLSAGQPQNTANRPLSCLPYRTNNRASKRELIRWNDDTYQQTLLAMTWALEIRELPIPWDEIAAIVHPGATGEAFKQAVTKLRTRRLKEGLPVPPSRPGKDRPRHECEEELDVIVAKAKKVRRRITSNNNSSHDDGNDDRQPDSSAVEIMSVSPVSSDGSPTIARPVSTDSPVSLIVQVATGSIHHVQPRPTPVVARLQDRTNGLETDMDIPLPAPPTEGESSQAAAKPVATAGKEDVPKSHVHLDRPSGLMPATPPSLPRTPVDQTALPDDERELEPPPAPRSEPRRSHSRKRSGDGAAPASPNSKRRQPSIPELPESYVMPTTQQIEEMMPAGYFGRSRHRSFHGMGMGPYGGLIPNNPEMTPYFYPYGPTGYNMDGFPMDRRPAGRRNTASEGRPANVSPNVLHDYTYQRFGPNAAANLISQQQNLGGQQPSPMQPSPMQSSPMQPSSMQPSSMQPSSMQPSLMQPPMQPYMPNWNTGFNAMNGGYYNNHWNTPSSGFTNAHGGPLAFGPELKPSGSSQGEDEVKPFDSQNTSFGGQSTQDSFGSDIQGSRVTPSQPPPGSDNDRKRKVRDD